MVGVLFFSGGDDSGGDNGASGSSRIGWRKGLLAGLSTVGPALRV